MKENIEILLGDWGHWKSGANASGLGYPSDSAFTGMRVDGRRRVEPYAFMVDDDMRRLDTLINQLHPDFRAVVTAHYVWPGPVKAKLDRLKVARTSYYGSLDFAHRQLAYGMAGNYRINSPTILSGHLAQLSG